MEKEIKQPVNTYLKDRGKDPHNLSTKNLIILLFTDHPSKQYRSHREIAEAIHQHYGVTRSQGAISKALAPFLDRPFKVHNTKNFISRYLGHYMLLDWSTHNENLRYTLTSEGVFLKDYVYYEHGLKTPQTFVFWLHDPSNTSDHVIKQFELMLSDNYCDIFCHDNRLIIMLDPESNNLPLLSDMLKNFFSPYYDAYKALKQNK